jgi:hypothetical protein
VCRAQPASGECGIKMDDVEFGKTLISVHLYRFFVAPPLKFAMHARLFLLAVVLTALVPDARAADVHVRVGDPPAVNLDLPLFYAVERGVTLYREHNGSRPYVRLNFREAVFMVDEGNPYSRVRTMEGAEGFVRTVHLSNYWIRVSKSERRLYFYRGAELVRTFPIDLGYNTFANKERMGSDLEPDHWRTPEGSFFVASLNPRSKYYKAFVINYPTQRDAERGLAQGLINRQQYDAIVRAEQTWGMPPMNTPLGGWIEIHGHGTGGRTNWTQGCVAITDEEMDLLWRYVRVGTPVTIER